MNLKKILFYCIMLFPALFIAVVLIFLGRDLYEISKVDPAEIRLSLESHLANKKPLSFPFPEKALHLNPKKKTVFVFGESSVVISNGGTFSDFIELNHPELQVVNFGLSGVDSFTIRQRVGEALSFARPDIIILYYGHNDYNNAYQGFIMPRYFEKFNFVLSVLRRFHNFDEPTGVILHQDQYWFARLYRPILYKLFEKIGLINIKSSDYAPINELIAKHYEQNNEAIMDMAASKKAPVILITPVGNWHAEPYGDINTTTALYQQGMATTDYRQSIHKLILAKDSETLTYDLRAKSLIVQYIRKYSQPGVYVLDLEERLEAMRFNFSYSDFLDYFHFNEKTHSIIARLIYDRMEQAGLVAQGIEHK